MLLRSADPAEYPHLVSLINLAYRGNPTGWSSEASIASGPRMTLDLLQDDVAAAPAAHFLAAHDAPEEPAIGTVWLDPAPDHTWYLGLLTIHPSLQERHLGRQLLAEAEAYAKQHGAQRIRMTVVNVRDQLIAWYRRRGYTLSGDTRPYPPHNRAGKPLVDGMHFVVMQKAL